jgi:hypothetical protein
MLTWNTEIERKQGLPIKRDRVNRIARFRLDQTAAALIEPAPAARRVVISAEKIVPETKIRSDFERTVIPFYLVDALCEVPYDARPTLMPCEYYLHKDHIGEWLTLSRTDEGTTEYLERYVLSAPCFEVYLQRIGGRRRLSQLRRIELSTQRVLSLEADRCGVLSSLVYHWARHLVSCGNVSSRYCDAGGCGKFRSP